MEPSRAPPWTDQIARYLRTPFRASVVVVVAAWVFALRNGVHAELSTIAGVFLASAALGGLAGGLVDARPRGVALALSSLAATAAAVILLHASVDARVAAAGGAAGDVLRGALPWIGVGCLVVSLLGTGLGLLARARFDRRG